ncbi:MAG: hypothetical protein ACUVRZ_08185 [Desulfobacca sp.]|uniref:hypothetical protein n=1 Tax=Desulfobacca sp. TaxID=2067990 RepID=UPI00404A67F0
MLKARSTSSLLLAEVVPGPNWEPELGPVSLALGLTEFCLLEGLAVQSADLLLQTAATLLPPLTGRLWHWGEDLYALPRRQLLPRRRHLAFVSPKHSLLPRLTLQENLSLAHVLTTPHRRVDLLQRHGQLLDRLDLTAYLGYYPRDLPPRQYQLALWARELVKEPRLLLGVLAGQEEPHGAPTMAPYLLPLLQDYHKNGLGAILLAGPWLAVVHPLADRRFVLRDRGWQEEPLPRRHCHPLAAYLQVL